MVELKIINKTNITYDLKDENEKKYELNIEFFDIEETPKIGDKIYISAELLNPRYAGYSTSYTFGNLKSKYGKEEVKLTDIDVIKVVTDKMEIYLKRLYG